MPLQIDDPKLVAKLLKKRRLSGGDRYDEVWDGIYIMSPLANDEHQMLVTDISAVFATVIKFNSLGQVRAGVNVSDRAKGWRDNYRCPDVAVKLNGGIAKILKNHWFGGPDFCIEIVSEGDRSRKKIDFYSAIGTRELLIIDRDPWSLELHGLRDGHLVPIGVSRVGSSVTLTSEVLPFSFRLIEGQPSPRIEVSHIGSGQTWII
jgi:Uma2 family endonuclease